MKIHDKKRLGPLTKRLGITSKLVILLLLFLLIFYGTLANMFFHIKNMNFISNQIVTINNTISSEIKVVIESLFEMDTNDKKYRLLQKDIYREYFHAAQKRLETSLEILISLEEHDYSTTQVLTNFSQDYKLLKETFQKNHPSPTWIDDQTLNSWIDNLIQLKNSNEQHIEKSLKQIHKRSLLTSRDGMTGFCFSVITACFGVWFISKSLLAPLREITQCLKTLSRGDYHKSITVSSSGEFRKLATAFNEMSKELREQENLRTDFIATLSHEIRTPLSSIQESVNMIAEELLGTVNKKQRKFLQIASTEISRITQLLNQLMQSSLLETGSVERTPEPINSSDMVLHSTASLVAKAEPKNINFHYDLPKNQLHVLGVREEFLQVFHNLIENAVKFSPKNSTISLSLAQITKSAFIQFEISDQGPGIPSDEISLVFNRYYRSRTVRNHMDGVGLGLSISQKLIVTSGGTLSVHNNNGPGCTFTILLPQATPDLHHISAKVNS